MHIFSEVLDECVACSYSILADAYARCKCELRILKFLLDNKFLNFDFVQEGKLV